jgi:hypothetical protein
MMIASRLGELTDKGKLHFVELRRIRTSRKQDGTELFPWYSEYVLPELYGCKHLMVRLHNNEEDAAPRVQPDPEREPPSRRATRIQGDLQLKPLP